MYKIMLIEDDATIARAMEEHLARWGYEVFAASRFDNIIEQFVAEKPQLVLMDIGLPFYNGFHWCNEIRKVSKVPIMFISSASDNMNIVMAVNMGGDDFVAKPFELTVLTAKIQALLRRAYSFREQVNVLEHKGVILNLSDTTILYNQQRIELTKNDYRIFELLMENAGNVVPREKIMEALWESDSYIDDNTLTVNMTRLRKKLEEFGITDFIKTKKGIGYMVE